MLRIVLIYLTLLQLSCKITLADNHGGETGPAEYGFQYHVKDEEGGLDYAHQEQRDGLNTKGSYHALLPDGRTIVVEYVADENGFQPSISYTNDGHSAGALKSNTKVNHISRPQVTNSKTVPIKNNAAQFRPNDRFGPSKGTGLFNTNDNLSPSNDFGLFKSNNNFNPSKGFGSVNNGPKLPQTLDGNSAIQQTNAQLSPPRKTVEINENIPEQIPLLHSIQNSQSSFSSSDSSQNFQSETVETSQSSGDFNNFNDNFDQSVFPDQLSLQKDISQSLFGIPQQNFRRGNFDSPSISNQKLQPQNLPQTFFGASGQNIGRDTFNSPNRLNQAPLNKGQSQNVAGITQQNPGQSGFPAHLSQQNGFGLETDNRRENIDQSRFQNFAANVRGNGFDQSSFSNQASPQGGLQQNVDGLNRDNVQLVQFPEQPQNFQPTSQFGPQSQFSNNQFASQPARQNRAFQFPNNHQRNSFERSSPQSQNNGFRTSPINREDIFANVQIETGFKPILAPNSGNRRNSGAISSDSNAEFGRKFN